MSMHVNFPRSDTNEIRKAGGVDRGMSVGPGKRQGGGEWGGGRRWGAGGAGEGGKASLGRLQTFFFPTDFLYTKQEAGRS